MILRHVPIALAAISLAIPVSAQSDNVDRAQQALSLEQRTALRCSAAFAIVSALQARGGAQEYPPLAQPGREYFVRSAAQLIDDTGIDRAGIAAIMQREAEAMSDADRLEAAMPACLLLLDSSGL